RRQGKPHPEQVRAGGVEARSPSPRVGCLRPPATAVPERWLRPGVLPKRGTGEQNPAYVGLRALPHLSRRLLSFFLRRRMRIALMDDYQGWALKSADWSKLPADCKVEVFHDHVADENAL